MRIVLLISTSIVSMLIAGCGGGGSGSPPPDPSPPLAIQPTSATIGAGTTQKFAATGGHTPYSYSVTSGTGTIDASGVFTGSASAGTATVRVTDAAGASSTASVTINASLAMNAGAITVTASSGQSFQFSGTAGAGTGYQYSLISGTGAITPDGLYTPGNTPGKETVQVRDAQGTTASATVQVLRVRTNGTVNSMAASGSSLYLAGSFSAVNPYLTSRMAVLDVSSGKPQLQCDLNTGFDAPVFEILLLNNSLYVAGEFTSYKGLPARGLAKLDATTCALDTTFTQSMGFAGTFTTNPSLQIVLPTYVTAVAASGSSLYVTGNFTSYRGLPANYLAKLDPQTGALDQTFTGSSGADGPLNNLALSADSVYVAGNFSHYRGASVTQSAPVKLDIKSGALDPAFRVTGLLSDVTALLYSGNSLYIAAQLTQSTVPGGTVIKVDPATGVRDSAFTAPSAQFGEPVYGMAASGQSLYVSAPFTTNVNGGSQANLIKLNAATGQQDSSFNQAPSVDAVKNSFAISGSSIYLVGGFRAPGSQSTPGILKLDATTGSPDATFGLKPGFGGTPYTVAVGATSVYVGGAMSGYGGAAASNIAKIDAASGVPDAAFDMAGGTEGPVYKVLISGSSLYLGGWFYQYGGTQCGLIAKADINTGAPDTTFMQGGGFELNPYALMSGNYAPAVNALAISGTSLYVGGHFTDYRGQTAGELAKLDVSTGDLDATFGQGQGFLPPASPGGHPPDSNVLALAVTPNGLYVAGNLQQYRGAAVGSLLKLDLGSGAVDVAFASPFSVPSAIPSNMALLASGTSLYVANSLAFGGGLTNTGVSKLDAVSGAVDATFNLALSARGIGTAAVDVINDMALSGSSLYVAGDFTQDLGSTSAGPVNGLIKADAATGNLDTAFSQPGGPDGAVNSLLLVPGSLYIGGSFSSYRNGLATFSAALDPASGANQDVAAF